MIQGFDMDSDNNVYNSTMCVNNNNHIHISNLVLYDIE